MVPYAIGVLVIRSIYKDKRNSGKHDIIYIYIYTPVTHNSTA